SSPAWRRCRPARVRRRSPWGSAGCRRRAASACQPLRFTSIASRTSSRSALSSMVSFSRISMARRRLPSRPALNSFAGSLSFAPLAKVSFTLSLYTSPVQMMPSQDHTGTPFGVGGLAPFHFLDDCRVSAADDLAHSRERLAAPVAEFAQAGVDELRGGCFCVPSGHASLLVAAQVGQREQVQAAEQQQEQRRQRRIRHPGGRRPLAHGDEVGDDRQREDDRQPAVKLTDKDAHRFPPLRVVLAAHLTQPRQYLVEILEMPPAVFRASGAAGCITFGLWVGQGRREKGEGRRKKSPAASRRPPLEKGVKVSASSLLPLLTSHFSPLTSKKTAAFACRRRFAECGFLRWQ